MELSNKFSEQARQNDVLEEKGGRNIVIIGAGEHAKVVISAVESIQRRVEWVLDHDPNRTSREIFGYPVKMYTAATLPFLINHGHDAIIAIGDNETRRKIADCLRAAAWATVVHRKAIVDARSSIGQGTFLGAASVVNPQATVGMHVIVNTAAVVEHDVVVGDYCHIAPNATLCGNVTIGEGTMVGAGSVVLPGRSVGSWSYVGAGAVVTRDIPAGVTTMGVPSRICSR